MTRWTYDLLFRWLVGMDMDEPIWAPTVFTKNRDRLLNQEIARSFFRRVLEHAAGLMPDEHFTVDGTLIDAGWGALRHKETRCTRADANRTERTEVMANRTA
jgi:transposase